MATQQTRMNADAFVIPASFAQQRLWVLDRMERDSSAYNVPLVMRLRGQLDIGALEHALTALVERHEALRTTFTLVEGVPHQLVVPAQPLRLGVTDLRGRPDAEQAALTLAESQSAEIFDLTEGPLLRAGLIQIGDADQLLSFSMHHAIMDAWSMRVLNRELALLYGAFAEGRDIALPELPIQYGDYAVWQQDWINSGGLTRQLEYWKQHLDGAPALLEVPTDFPRPSVQSFRGARSSALVSRSVFDRLAALSKQEGATLFMTLLAAYVALLARYTGGDDIVVATPVANRNRLELEGLIGVFANTLPLRTKLAGDPSFLELLAGVREAALDGVSNQDLPFEKLVEELNPQRHLSHTPLAQVMFVHHGAQEAPITWSGLEREAVATDRGTSKFDLTLSVEERPDGLLATFEYCTALFRESTVARMLGHYETLLEAIAEDPTRPVAELPILTPAERSQLDGWNRTPAPYPHVCLHELFADRAAAAPEAVAVVCGEDQISYSELDHRANQLARELRDMGVGPGHLIGLCTERSVEQVIGMFGVLKAGAAYVPIDPGHPPDRQAFMLHDAQVRVLLTQSHLIEGLPTHGARVVCLDRDWLPVGAQPSGPAPAAPGDFQQLAYVIYTSGSTGRPKGVQITHRSVVNLITHMSRHPGIDENDVVANLTTPAFDLSVPDFYLPLCHGARLVIVPHEETRLGTLLAERLERSGATFVQATPTTWQMLLDCGWPGSDRLKIVCGGEAVNRPLADQLLQRGAALWHMYGPTETTVWSAVLPVARDEPTVPLGGPIANTSFWVLDDRRGLLPIGVPGELCIGGHGLARGYLNRAELTAEKFVADPFSPDGGRLYRTGDLVRWRDDGTLEFLGRIDHQIKLRGFRVELGEIESVLREHVAVREALVVAREDDPGDQRLVAYLIGDALPDPGELRAFMHRTLPEYMIPSAFVNIEAFPLNANGKIDRGALPAPDGRAVTSVEYVEASTDLECALAEIWQPLLKLDRVGIDDNFFDLGGHSLLAVQLVMRIEEQLGRTCTLQMLFRTGTIRSLAAELRAGGADADEAAVIRLQPDGDGPALFCICGVHAYQDLADALAPEIPVYGLFLPVEQELFATGNGNGEGKATGPSVEAMAASYLEAVRAQQPTGPYLLLGFCFGGILAFEMAHQLVAAGEEVGMLAMLDAVLPSIQRDWRRAVRDETRRFAVQAYEALPRPVRASLGLRKVTPLEALNETQRLERVRTGIYVEARRRYKARLFPGSALMVRPESMVQRRDMEDPSFGWGKYLGKIEILDVPGTHMSHLKRPQVRDLVSQLRPYLDRARAGKFSRT